VNWPQRYSQLLSAGSESEVLPAAALGLVVVHDTKLVQSAFRTFASAVTLMAS
jgi:hypothetical protein